jgi:thiamine pyrophosphokinase
VFAFGGRAKGVVISGMQYPLAGQTLDSATPRGVSNALNGEGAVALSEGILLCFWEAAIQAYFVRT